MCLSYENSNLPPESNLSGVVNSFVEPVLVVKAYNPNPFSPPKFQAYCPEAPWSNQVFPKLKFS